MPACTHLTPALLYMCLRGSERRWPVVVCEGSLKPLKAWSCVLHTHFWVEAICRMLWLCSLSDTIFRAKAFEYAHCCNIINKRDDMLPPLHPLSLRNSLYKSLICWCWQMTLSVYNIGFSSLWVFLFVQVFGGTLADLIFKAYFFPLRWL